MKKIFAILFSLCISFAFAQESNKVEVNNDGDVIVATYYHDNGEVAQKGTYNKDGVLHGIWTSYDQSGNKLAVGNYNNGRKVGKWLFWSDSTLKEVDYVDSRIASVKEWTDNVEVEVASRN